MSNRRDFLKRSVLLGTIATLPPAFHTASAAPARKPGKKIKLSFAFMTDIHLNRDNDDDRINGLKLALKRVKDTAAEFIVLGGDLVDISGMSENLSKEQTDGMYTLFKQIMNQSGLPYYPAIGNHDRYFDKEAGYTVGDEVFKFHFGNSYYTFEQKGIRFFILNSVQPGETDDYFVGNEEMEWLKQELAHVSPLTPLVAVVHVPVYSIYFPVVEGKFIFADIIKNYKELLHAFKGHNLKLVLQGHQHLYEEIYSQRVQYITGGSVCANWWKGPFHETEEGFLLVDVDEENNFHWQYVDYGWDAK